MVFPAQSCNQKYPETQTTPDTSLTSSPSSSKRPATRLIWGKAETEILLNSWKDNFSYLETVHKSLAWATIYSAVQTVSDRSLDACKKKVQNAKDNYTKAKKLNEDIGQILHKLEGYDIFDEIYGSRDVVKIPYFKDIYANRGTKTNPGQFPDRQFPDGSFPDRTIPRQDNSQTYYSPNGRFPERTIPRLMKN
uniref:Myb/SANT-like DNA-binding domain-containing protein n=1 Tax=Clytia hemisphaerica TaxID=252671 RepID=A0A7M5UX07_9CNID|eukprot:TCONS_00063131-protein